MNNQKGPSDTQGDEPYRIASADEEERKEIAMKVYRQLKASFSRFNKPDGSKDFPARTCKEILAHHPESTSGQYWIDPNEGDTKDAILVECDMKRGASCIVPQQRRSSKIRNSAIDAEGVWLGESRDGFKMHYKAHSNQITYLQLLSSHADQNLTYHCKNSVAYYDAEAKTHKQGLKLLAWNDAELLPKGNVRLRYEALIDDCQYRSAHWEKTLLRYTTDKTTRLPIVDVAIRDDKQAGNQMFWLEIGNACFY